MRRAFEVVLLALALTAGLELRLRVGEGWTFRGADSYFYMGTASELRDHHRYAYRMPHWFHLRPPEPPLVWCRPPLYPTFLAAATPPPVKDYPDYFEATKPVQAVLDVATCALVYLVARRLRGLLAAWIALGLALVWPPTVLFTGSILTETLATFLTTAGLAAIVVALDEETSARRARVALGVAGAYAALGLLVRADGVLLLPCMAVPLLVRRDHPIRERVGAFAVAAAVAALLFAPWPLRNWKEFGAFHPFGSTCDTRGDPITHRGFMRWFSTWMESEAAAPTTLYCFFRPECVAQVTSYPPEAFGSPAERKELGRLFHLRAMKGFTGELDRGFLALARARIRRDPVHTLLWLPLVRAYNVWTGPNDLPLRPLDATPWPAAREWVRPTTEYQGTFLLVFGLLGLLVLAGARDWRRGAMWLAGCALLTRTVFLAAATFIETRYVLELAPLMLILAGVALAHGIEAIGRALAATTRWVTGSIRDR